MIQTPSLSFPTIDWRKRFRPRNKARAVFATLPIIYLMLLAGIIIYRSSNRASVLASIDKDAAALPENASDQSADGISSKVLLEDFHRIEIKNGKPAWEVRAKDAKYYPQDLVIHVNQAALTIFREKKESVTVHSEAAKLYRSQTALSRAALDGNIQIETGDGMLIQTESAEFDALARIFQAPGKVTIHGNGYSVEGEGFRFFVESGIVSFSRNVHCTFESGAKIPENLHVN